MGAAGQLEQPDDTHRHPDHQHAGGWLAVDPSLVLAFRDATPNIIYYVYDPHTHTRAHLLFHGQDSAKIKSGLHFNRYYRNQLRRVLRAR